MLVLFVLKITNSNYNCLQRIAHYFLKTMQLLEKRKTTKTKTKQQRKIK